jgi:hypothetical protein
VVHGHISKLCVYYKNYTVIGRLGIPLIVIFPHAVRKTVHNNARDICHEKFADTCCVRPSTRKFSTARSGNLLTDECGLSLAKVSGGLRGCYPVSLGTQLSTFRRQDDPSKRLQLFAQRHGVTDWRN